MFSMQQKLLRAKDSRGLITVQSEEAPTSTTDSGLKIQDLSTESYKLGMDEIAVWIGHEVTEKRLR
ncbi:MAG: hypothetical protein EBR26_06965 [Microbacteriaceae bacterium]|nr:hypothetical protein [Microbacteriaceae bacterium]